MGIKRMGLPKHMVIDFAKEFGINTFLEAGTFYADTAIWASSHFDKVLTIEASEVIYNRAKNKHGSNQKIEFLFGHSTAKIEQVLAKTDEPLLMWLDAHWSGGETYGEQDECPLLNELKLILSSNHNHIVLIDDARLFLTPPPQPHNSGMWPTIVEIAEKLNAHGYDAFVYEDVIFAFPLSSKPYFENYFQQVITLKHQHKTSFSSRVLGTLIKLLTRAQDKWTH